MNFKTDENLPVEVVGLLRQYGHDAMSVQDQQLAGRPDVTIAGVCRAEQRTLVTLDLDFADLRTYPPEEYSGIVILRPHVQTITAILKLVERMIQLLTIESLLGYLWIVTERGVRIRGGGNGTR